MPDSQFFHVTSRGELVPVASPEKALTAARKGGYAWLDYPEPDMEALTRLILPLGLNFLAVEDCLDENQLPKIDHYPKNTFALFNSFSIVRGRIAIGEADLFIGKDFLVTVRCHDPGSRHLLSGIERLVELDSEGVKRGPAFLMHAVIDHLVEGKSAAIEALEERLDRAEESILSDLSDFKPEGLLHLRRDLLAVRKSLFHERELVGKICRNDSPYIPEKALPLYRDVYDHLTKYFELTETLRDTVTSLMELYTSMLSNRMAASANETNLTVRRLTFITTIFMPLTLLSGIFGMSEWSMMTGTNHWKIAYPLFLLAMAVLGVANYYLLKALENKDQAQDSTRRAKRPREADKSRWNA
jgi:magnesium transporter